MDDIARPFWAIKYGDDEKYQGFHQLTLQGYIGVGWSYAGDITKAYTTDTIREKLRVTMPAERLKDLAHDTGILNAFINKTQEGDFVACHDQEDGYIYIGRFVGPCVYDTNLHKHFHLLRKVEWIHPVPSGLIPGSVKTLSNRGTFWQVKDFSELIKAYQTYGRFKMRVDSASRYQG